MLSKIFPKGRAQEKAWKPVTAEEVLPPLPREANYKDFGEFRIIMSDGKLVVQEPPLPKNLHDLINASTIRSMLFEGSPESKLLRGYLSVAVDKGLSPKEILSGWYHVRNRCLRYGKITPLLQDPEIEDITCSSETVYIYHSRYGYRPTNVQFEPEELQEFTYSLAQKCGSTISFDHPIVDETLADGSRLHVTQFISKNPSFTIRKIRKSPLTLPALVDAGVMTEDIAALLWLAVMSRCSIMFIGGMGVGKTTTMNAIALCIPPNSKVVSIEDTFEVVLPHKNWNAMITRGNVKLIDLVKAALRQRPEYLILGEGRDVEVRDIFTAMGLGHTVLTTFHSSDPVSALRRLQGDPFLLKKDQLGFLDFIVTVMITDEGRKVVSVDRVGSPRGERAVSDLYLGNIGSLKGGKFVINDLDQGLERCAEKSFRSYEEVKKEFKEKRAIIKDLPRDAFELFKAMHNLNGGSM